MGVDTRVVVPRNRKQTTIDFGSPNVSQIASISNKNVKNKTFSLFLTALLSTTMGADYGCYKICR